MLWRYRGTVNELTKTAKRLDALPRSPEQQQQQLRTASGTSKTRQINTSPIQSSAGDGGASRQQVAFDVAIGIGQSTKTRLHRLPPLTYVHMRGVIATAIPSTIVSAAMLEVFVYYKRRTHGTQNNY